MVIYGVALLSFCMLVGVFVGDILGKLIGVQANVGGVGIAMLLLSRRGRRCCELCASCGHRRFSATRSKWFLKRLRRCSPKTR